MSNKPSGMKFRDEDGNRLQTWRRYKPGVDYKVAEGNMMVALIDSIQQRKRNLGGRPPKFETKEQLETKIDEYWEYLKDMNSNGMMVIPDIEGLASYLGVCRQQIFEWEKADYRGFADTLKQARNDIATIKKQMALEGCIPPIVFATDFNNNHGYTQKQTVEVETPRALEIPTEELIAQADLLPEK